MSHLTRFALVCAALLVLLALVQAYDPVLQVSQKTRLLEEGEQARETVSIRDGAEEFHVVVIFSANEVSGFVALKKDAPEFVDAPATLTRLFKTADFLKRYTEVKREIIENQTLSWFLSEGRRTRNLASFLVTERDEDLAIISEELSAPEALQSIAAMQNILTAMEEQTLQLSEAMDDAVNTETMFINNPFTGGEQTVVNREEVVFGQVESLDDLALQYQSELRKLKLEISTSALDPDSKKSLLTLANLSEDISVIGEWANDVGQLRSGVSSALSQAGAQAGNWQAGLEQRVQRAEAFHALFEHDETLAQEAGADYSPLKSAADIILSPENRPHWQAQGDLKRLDDAWRRANAHFAQGEYEQAMQEAATAKAMVPRIVKAGVIEPPPPPDPNFLRNILLGVAAILILAILAHKRETILRFFKREEEESDIEV